MVPIILPRSSNRQSDPPLVRVILNSSIPPSRRTNAVGSSHRSTRGRTERFLAIAGGLPRVDYTRRVPADAGRSFANGDPFSVGQNPVITARAERALRAFDPHANHRIDRKRSR